MSSGERVCREAIWTHLVVRKDVQATHDLYVRILARLFALVGQNVFRGVGVPRPLNGRPHERVKLKRDEPMCD